MHFVCHAIFYKAYFILSRCTLRCVPVVCSRRTGADRGEPERTVKEFECVHTFPAALRKRSGLGQKVITVCPGYVTVYGSSLPVQPRRRYGVSRCVPIHHGSAPGIGDRAPVSLRRVPKVSRQSPGVARQHMHINETSVNLDMSFAKYRTQVTYQGKTNSIRVEEKVGNVVCNEKLLCLNISSIYIIIKLLRLILLT